MTYCSIFFLFDNFGYMNDQKLIAILKRVPARNITFFIKINDRPKVHQITL